MLQATRTILLVEDDDEVAETLQDVLEDGGYCARRAANGTEARGALATTLPDLVLLDLMLPDVDGLLFCRELKAASQVPIVICSGSPHPRDRVLGLKMGADDFVDKPFDVDELLARIEAVLRRTAHPTSAPAEPKARLQAGALVLDRARKQALLAGQWVRLTPTQYRILGAFASHPEQVLTREQLAEAAWGFGNPDTAKSVDVHVRRLRARLSAAAECAPAIVTCPGFGYMLQVAEPAAGPG